MNTLVEGDLESIEQVIEFTQSLSEQDYQVCAKPYFNSPVGQHIRHVLDMYLSLSLSLKKGVDTRQFDYNLRRRGNTVESDKKPAFWNWAKYTPDYSRLLWFQWKSK